MQIDPIRIVSRALVACVVIAGVATGAGCSKQNDNGETSGSNASLGAPGNIAPGPAVLPNGASQPDAPPTPAAPASGS